jgi:hypothetical protein
MAGVLLRGEITDYFTRQEARVLGGTRFALFFLNNPLQSAGSDQVL